MRATSQSFQDLIVWQKAHRFVIEIYRSTVLLPSSEKYGLMSQMRRAAVSVPANIAEGFRKRGKMDKIRLMNVAQGSLEESRYYLILSGDLDYLKTDALLRQLEEVSRLLQAYVAAIRASLS